MAWQHRADGFEGVEGWIDDERARAWARDALRHFQQARGAGTIAESKTHLRAALQSLDNATAALNLPLSQGSGDLLTRGFPLGVDRIELDASPEAKAAAQRAAVARFGSIEGARDWAMGQELGRYNLGPFFVRVFEGLDGSKSWTVEPAELDVLTWRRSQPATESERRAAAIVADPWAAYVARRKDIDATNARYAGYWGLTTPEQIAGFQVAADAVNRTLGAEWDARQRARVQSKANEILDTIAQYAGATVIGAPIAAVMQAVKLLTGILPWATEAQPPPALSRVRSGGISDKPIDRPTHFVPAPPVEPVEAVSTMTGTLTGLASMPSAAKTPGLGLPNLSPGAVRSLLGSGPVSGSSRIETTPGTTTGGGAVASSSSSGSSSSNTGVVLLVLGAGGLIYWLTR